MTLAGRLQCATVPNADHRHHDIPAGGEQWRARPADQEVDNRDRPVQRGRRGDTALRAVAFAEDPTRSSSYNFTDAAHARVQCLKYHHQVDDPSPTWLDLSEQIIDSVRL